MKKWAIAIVFLALTFSASAQTASSPPQPMVAMSSIGFPGTAYLGPGVKGKPYSAQRVTEHTQTLADGTHITRKPMTTQLYRDSEGRTRSEQQFMTGPNPAGDTPLLIQIDDPIAGYHYTLDTVNHIAHRVKSTPLPRPNSTAGAASSLTVAPLAVPHVSILPAPAAVTNGAVQPTTPDGRATTTENLGTQSIEGVIAQGHRTTRVIPAGLEGNDAPITIVNENWFSQQIGMPVLSKNSDPRNGENTTRLTNIVLGDPDPSLFQPPPGYEVVDETGPFQIKFTNTPPARQ